MSEEENKELEMLDEYDFSNSIIGKYATQYAQGTNVIVLDPDVARFFQGSAAVNRALRALSTDSTSRDEHHSTYRVWKDKTNKWGWYLMAANNRIIATSSERYETEDQCLEAIELVKSSVIAPVRVA